MKNKLFTFFLAFAASVGTMFADGTKIGDLYYNLNAANQTAEVTYEWANEKNYNGLIAANIPASVTYSGTTYSVTSIGDYDFWGMYDVRPIGAATTETTSVQITPSETAATVAWPTISGAETYEMVIKDRDGNVVCTLTFNSNGQLTEIAFNAPARNDAIEQTQATGFSFTVTGLEEGTSYDLTITAKDGNGTTLDEKTIAFTTSGETGVDALPTNELRSSKVLRNGEVLILRDGKTYTIQGVEVR